MTMPLQTPHHPSHPRLALLAALALALVLLAACTIPTSRLPGGEPTPEGPVQLVYQDWRTEWFPPMARKMLDQFHASHPDLRVFYTLDPPSDVFEQEMLADFQAGRAPDVFSGCCAFFPVWAQEGFTYDLRPFVARDLDQATIDDWDPVQYRSYFTDDGRQYALPKYHGALALYYNKDIFDRYGVPYPDESWDYEDYLDAMRRLTVDENGDGQTDIWGSMLDISWDRIQVHVNAWGGHFVDPEDPTNSRMDEAEALAAMEWIRARMWDDRAMATPLDVNNLNPWDAFAAGRLAMVEDGSWALKDILANSDFRIGVAPMPAGPVRRATLATTDGFAIFSDTQHPEEAWELLQFLISPDYGRAMAQAQFLQPARLSLVDDWIATIREQYPTKAGQMDLAVFADGQLKGYSVIAEHFANQTEASRLASAAWEQIYLLGQAPVSTMVDVSRQIEATQP